MYLPVQILRVVHESAHAWQSTVCIPIVDSISSAASLSTSWVASPFSSGLPPPNSNYYSYVFDNSSDFDDDDSSETAVFYDNYSYDSHSD
ncbi:hypothetical protein ACJRO7_034347 [Eucalyptus globulus]|uniref:Uncharacterized protein n=1 Tax=Eucalyptus globulus TaxID=34317 RepID=A0ABD3J2N9_EUCGL